MASEIRDFLEIEKRPVDEMDAAELAAEVEGWRYLIAMLPSEVLEWSARLHETIRFTKRNYQGSAGILIGFKLEALEFTIALREGYFDSLTGVRMVEDKILTIPANFIAYYEVIGDRQEYDVQQEDAALAATSLE